MPAYTEEEMQNAIAAVENGCSLHQASKQYKIPRSTLRNRLHGASSKEEVNHDRQKLSATEETSLANWARIQHAFGLPLTHRQLRLAAQRMLAISGSNASLGKHWTSYFLRRNPSLKAMKGTHIEKSRAEAVTPEKIKKMYAVFDEPLVKAIRPQNRWNVDETGIMDGITFPGLFIGPSDKSEQLQNRKKGPIGDRSSSVFPPRAMLFHPRSFLKAKTSSNNGFQMTKEIRQRECQAYRIWIAVLPPHSSHITQPLDVSVFSSLKIRYRQFRDDIALVSNADTLSKEDFLMCYYRARMQSFTAQNIRSGWRQSGLWPLDVSIPLDNPRLFQPPSEMIEEIAQETPTKETGTLDCFQTPAGGADLRKQAQAGPSFQTREQRLVIRKACKALDAKNAKIADMDRQVKSLQQLTRRLQPKRRAKVVAQDPNEKFIMMPDVAEARKKLARKAAREKEPDYEIAGFDDIFD